MRKALAVAVTSLALVLTLPGVAVGVEVRATQAVRLSLGPCQEMPGAEQPTGCLAVTTFTPGCSSVLVAVFGTRWRAGPVTRCPFVRSDVIVWEDATGGTVRVRYAKVQSGDTLRRVAYRAYGDRSLWRLIARTNNVADPLRAGRVLVLPPRR